MDLLRESGPHPVVPGAAEKALALLEVLGEAEEGLRLSEIARRADMAKSTTHRLLGVLAAHRMVSSVDGSYALGNRILEWVAPAAEREALSLKAIAMPYLIDLYNQTHGVVYLGVLKGGGIVCYLANLFGHQSVKTPSRSRGWAPAERTAAGKILLAGLSWPDGTLPAELAKVRKYGVAYSQDEYVSGVSCVAVGIVDSSGKTCGAIAVADRTDQLNSKLVLHQLRRTGSAASVAVQRAWRLGSIEVE